MYGFFKMGIEQELANITPERETFLTIGVFDGVHVGHRYLLENLKRRAQGENLLSGVITFDPHPQSILHPQSQLPRLGDLKDRVKSLRELGIDLVTTISFTIQVSQLSAQEFVSLLKKYLRMRGLMIGPDFALGKGREGNATLLAALGKAMGFSVEIIPPLTVNGEIASSTLIRQALTQGDLMKVEMLMGRRFTLSAKVVTSQKRGQSLGFPTANLDISLLQALPSNGVYATVAQVNGRHFASATNIGTRPTFGDNEKWVETHLLNYTGDLYNKEIKVEFIQKLREEQRFTSPEELKAQIAKDIREAETSLSGKLK